MTDVDDGEDLFELAHRALVELNALGRPSRSKDRAELRDAADGIPSHVFAWLAKRRAIGPAPAGPADARELTELGRAWLADPTLIGGSSGFDRMHRVLADFARAHGLTVGSDAHILAHKRDWLENLWKPLRDHAWPSDLHRYVHHLRSSQAFAFNMFGPLARDYTWAREVWSPWFERVARVTFEYPEEGDPLGEMRDGGGHRTRVDVKIDHGDGEATLIEVKLTEPELGGCSAGHDEDNPRRAFCSEPAWTAARAQSSCYLAADRKRRYFELLPESPIDVAALEAAGHDGCPFRGGRYQLARNLLMAGRAGAAKVHFRVLAPGPRLNPVLHASAGRGERALEAFLEAIAMKSRVSVGFIDFERVLDRARAMPGAAEWVAYMDAKYVAALNAAQIKP